MVLKKKSAGSHCSSKQSRGREKLSVLQTFRIFLPMIIVLLLIFRLALGISFISGNSMSPGFRDGQLVLYSRFSRKPETGSVVSAKLTSGEYVIKRVVALSGDLLEIRDGMVFINGEPETENYVNGKTFLPDKSEVISMVIPEGCIYIMGDNRSVSVDSRNYGPIAVDQLRGKLISLKH